MLKYIGDFDKLKEYGFYIEEDYFLLATVEKEKRYVSNDPNYEMAVVIVNQPINGFGEPDDREIYIISKRDVEHTDVDVPTVLYDLIKDGLVVKEEG